MRPTFWQALTRSTRRLLCRMLGHRTPRYRRPRRQEVGARAVDHFHCPRCGNGWFE